MLRSRPFLMFTGQAEAADFTLVKGQQIVDMEGDRVFR